MSLIVLLFCCRCLCRNSTLNCITAYTHQDLILMFVMGFFFPSGEPGGGDWWRCFAVRVAEGRKDCEATDICRRLLLIRF